MKTVKTLVALITFLVGVVMAGGGKMEHFEPLIGSLEKVTQHGLDSGNTAWVTVWTTDVPTGRFKTLRSVATNVSFSTKRQLDEYFTRQIALVAESAITKDAGQNKDLPFRITAEFYRGYFDLRYGGPSSSQYFQTFQNFKLIKEGDTYRLPDLSGIVLELSEKIDYWVKDLVWARVLITGPDGTTLLDTDSTYLKSSFVGPGFFSLKKEVAISGTNGDTRVRISVIDGPKNNFRVFGPNGELVPENQPQLKPVVYATKRRATPSSEQTGNLRIVGGEVGRTYEILQSDSIEGVWVSVPDTKTTVWSRYSSDDSVSLNVVGDKSFFRLQSVEVAPTFR